MLETSIWLQLLFPVQTMNKHIAPCKFSTNQVITILVLQTEKIIFIFHRFTYTATESYIIIYFRKLIHTLFEYITYTICICMLVNSHLNPPWSRISTHNWKISTCFIFNLRNIQQIRRMGINALGVISHQKLKKLFGKIK